MIPKIGEYVIYPHMAGYIYKVVEKPGFEYAIGDISDYYVTIVVDPHTNPRINFIHSINSKSLATQLQPYVIGPSKLERVIYGIPYGD